MSAIRQASAWGQRRHLFMGGNKSVITKAAEAFTARGQSIIEPDVPFSSTVTAAVAGAELFASARDVAFRLPPCLAQQSCDCIEAHASPETTSVEGFVWISFSLLAVALIFSQPSMQPPPAIQKATVSARTTRTSLVERDFIKVLSLNLACVSCRVTFRPGVTTSQEQQTEGQHLAP